MQPRLPGDVIVKLVEAKHAAFRRAGADLHTEVTITLREALLGFERSLGGWKMVRKWWKKARNMRISRYEMGNFTWRN